VGEGMKFSKEYSKLALEEFTTIRKFSMYYRVGSKINIRTPIRTFQAIVLSRAVIHKDQITEELAQSDADCSREELISMLEKWYGKRFDDFILLRLRKI